MIVNKDFNLFQLKLKLQSRIKATGATTILDLVRILKSGLFNKDCNLWCYISQDFQFFCIPSKCFLGCEYQGFARVMLPLRKIKLQLFKKKWDIWYYEIQYYNIILAPLCNKQIIKGYNAIKSIRLINRLCVYDGIKDCVTWRKI